MSRTEWLVLLMASALGTVVVLLACVPLLRSCWIFWYPPYFDNLTIASQYYTVIAGLSAATIPAIGICMGYIYFAKRERFEQTVHAQARKREFARMMLDYIERYHLDLSSIFHKEFSSQNELTKLRHNAESQFFGVQISMEQQSQDAIFSANERDVFWELNAIVQKHKMLFHHKDCQKVLDYEFSDLWDRYFDYYKKVHKLCISKLVEATL